tara:strand:+ start:586 stop:1842 length:1257 start_codon:yes stop_codon:yes gene_type:complete
MIKKTILLFSFCFSLESADGVVAVVGDFPILKSSVLQSAQMLLFQKGKNSFSNQDELNLLLNESLENLINQRVLFEKAKQDTDIVVTNDDVINYMDNYIDNLIMQHGSKENLENVLDQSINSFKRESWDDVYKLIVTERFQQKILIDFDVSINDVKKFYKINSSNLPLLPKKYKFSLIEIPILPSEERKKEIYNFLISLKDSIKALSFEKLAIAHSEDPGSSYNGGDLGYISRGTLVKEYEKVAFGLEIGQISDPILSEFGYHLILLVDKKGEKIRTKHILKTITPNNLDREKARENLIKINNIVSSNISSFDSIATVFSKKENNISSVKNDWIYSTDMDERIEKELSSLQENSISFPIEMDNSFLLIKLNNKQEETNPTLENSWTFIKNLAYQDKLTSKLNKLLDVYKNEIYIKYYD